MKLIGVDVGGTFTDIVFTSMDTARRDFGVVITPEMTVDPNATTAMRARFL